jgi:glycosyltransferase involved in cell wall biosynthesis
VIKVAHVTTIDLSLRFLLLNQMRNLAQAGFDITGVSAAGSHVPALQAHGIHHIAVPMTRSITPIADLVALWRLYRVFKRERFTVVHCHTPKAELLGQVAARLARIPIVVDTYRGIYDRAGSSRLRRWLLVTLSRLAASCADLVLCQSREAAEELRRERFCDPHRLALLGNGVDVRQFDRTRLIPAEIEDARRSLGLDAGRPVIGFVGRLVREKGILDLIAAMRLVRAQVPGAQLLVVGPTDEAKPDAVMPQLAGLGNPGDGYVFAGLRTDMPVLYGLMDVFVLPSYREGFPRAPMEASAMGVPCVVTDIPGCREVVQHGHNGLLVPTSSPSALAGAITTVLMHGDLAGRMGQAGRQRAMTDFDEEHVFAIVKAAYVRLLSEKGLAPAKGARRESVPQPAQS